MSDLDDLPPAAPSPADVDLVVGLGASAGGIEALQQFFGRADVPGSAAYVVILHLSPNHDSRLAEVLQATTDMPVTRVEEMATIEPGHVYVISPDRSLVIRDSRLIAQPVTRVEERRAPVDVFFRSLAEAYGTRAACVVLSGTGPNGSSGLKRIKEYGGLTVAQAPDEAEYDEMPRNAIATGLIDYPVPVAQMPGVIARYLRHLDELEVVPSLHPAQDQQHAVTEILTLLRLRTGHDFSNYKSGTLYRRIGRRMNVLGVDRLDDYAGELLQRQDEAAALMKELLISVTSFFRDPVAFDALERHLIPQLVRHKRGEEQLRVWVAGCATGEEAYSIAMMLAEFAATLADPPKIQMFATDLDAHAIAIAREGVYSGAEIADVSEDRLRRFFHKERDRYRVKRELRDQILFAHHNVIKDPPFSHIDLIACRNVLIYLNRSVQERVIETFHFALRPGGFLFLGASETPESADQLFAVRDKVGHLYEARLAATRSIPSLDAGLTTTKSTVRPPEFRPSERILPAELHQRLLEQMAPPSIVVTDEYQVVHVSDTAGAFLQVGGGEPSRDVLKMIRQELRADLRSALHSAMQQRQNVKVSNLLLDGNLAGKRITLVVKPVLRDGPPDRGYLLIVFQPATAADDTAAPLAPATSAAAEQLDEELQRVRGQLRMTVEQYETQVEEAKAANEELHAMNEELETSKEELQSVNEELTTVNQELKVKVEELAATNNDFHNLINSTDIGTIFLDRLLRVKLSTPRAVEIFNLLPSDVGRPLSDITSSLTNPGLHEDLRSVLDRLQNVEREVQTKTGRWYGMRALPYRTIDNRIDGVVITFQETTQQRLADLRVRVSEERLRVLIDSVVDYAIFTLTGEGVIDSWNTGAERIFGYSSAEIIGQGFAILFTPEDRAAGIPEHELRTALARGRAEDERWHLRKDGSRLYCSGVTVRLGGSEEFGLAKIARDLTSQQNAQMALVKAHADLDDRVRQRTDQLQSEVSKLAAAEQHVTRLMRRLVTAQEDERRRIARDLHDQFGQQLTALRLTLERHQATCPGQEADDIRRALALAQRIDADVGFLAWELRPAALDDLGLAVALPRYVQEWAEHHQIEAHCRHSGLAKGQLPSEAEVALYRIAQEALNNVVKHAHASRVDVLLERRQRDVTLVVEDDGVGFDVAEAEASDRGIGIAGMRERAALVGARLEIESTPGKGTTIYVRRSVETN